MSEPVYTIKPLDWSYQFEGYYRAFVGDLASYVVARTDRGWRLTCNFCNRNEEDRFVDSLDAGKQKAWEDWTDRLREALQRVDLPAKDAECSMS